MNIFTKRIAERGERGRIKELIEAVNDNKDHLLSLDSGTLLDELLVILRPGRTTTLLLDDIAKITDLNQKYDGVKKGAHIYIQLKELSPDSNKYPELKILWKKDYETAIEIIKSLRSSSHYYVIMKNLLTKVELTAFCKGGDRRARWKLDSIHPEYAKEKGCYGVAAKLMYFILDIIEDDLRSKNITQYNTELEKCKEICKSEFSEREIAFISQLLPKSVCPMCLEKLELVDFFRNGRNDPKAIVFGHYEYRGARTGDVHIGKNAFWIHRTCNSIQGIYTIEEIINLLNTMVDKHKELTIDWEKRG